MRLHRAQQKGRRIIAGPIGGPANRKEPTMQKLASFIGALALSGLLFSVTIV